jgi:hypothetical protein
VKEEFLGKGGDPQSNGTMGCAVRERGLGICVKVFPATNRSNHQRVEAGTKPSATDTKEEGRDVEETDGEDAE